MLFVSWQNIYPNRIVSFFLCHAFAFWHAHADCECLIMSNNSFGCTLQIAVIQSEAHDSPFPLWPSGRPVPAADTNQRLKYRMWKVKGRPVQPASSCVSRLSRLVCASFNTHSINVRSLCSDFLRISIAAFHFILCFLTWTDFECEGKRGRGANGGLMRAGRCWFVWLGVFACATCHPVFN